MNKMLLCMSSDSTPLKSLASLMAVCCLLVACSGGQENQSTAPIGSVNDSDNGDNGAPENLALPFELSGSVMLDSMLADEAYVASADSVDKAISPSAIRGTAKNIILFIGDGMGISTVTAARILEGQRQGGSGEENVLSWGAMPFAGLAKTYNVNAQTADSAGTMTAIMTGVKTDAGVISVDADVQFGNCSSQSGNELVGALELAEIAGMSTGIVSTARITHATPAVTYAKSVNRGWENDALIPDSALTQGCTDIASQLIGFEARLEAAYPGLDVDGIEVVMGGGRRNFLPASEAFNSNDTLSPIEGARADGLDLTAQWQSLYPQGAYITDTAGFNAIDANDIPQIMGLFDESHMEYEANRANDLAGEPSLAQMTTKAIDVLDNNQRGYFLTIEAGRIDHAHHAGSAFGALTDTIAFSDAVQAAMDATDSSDTLIIVTADHSHVFTMGGIAKRGNPILGLSVGIGQSTPTLALDGLPYTTLAYANGLGFRDFGENTNFDLTYTEAAAAGRKDLSVVDTVSSGFHQEAMVSLSAETHGGEDVSIYAQGPGASLITGTVEQSVIFHAMEFAADLAGRANAALGSQ